MENKKRVESFMYDGILWKENDHHWQFLLVDKENDRIIAVVRAAKDEGNVFEFIPVEYTFENHKSYEVAIREIVSKLKNGK